MQVLLVAAHEAPTARLVSCVEAAGLAVAAVDLLPLALIRALARTGRSRDEGVSAEGIVSFGGGVTAIAVHEGGIPRFVRVLGSGGRELTDAISAELNIPTETAEALKRQLGAQRRRARDVVHAPRSSVRSRCCSTKSAARSTTTATSRARRGCCASSSPAARRSSPG